jgi:beta-RFAP synthase
MPNATVQVSAASRLHFGMVSFGSTGVPQFGGVGVMIDEGALQLTFEPANQFSATGPLAPRIYAAMPAICERLDLDGVPDCKINVCRAPGEHLGLGTGTQLHLSLAAGLSAWLGRSYSAPEELVGWAGRAARSSVGSYGFLEGGLIVERGKISDEPLGQLAARRELPAGWCFGLICPPGERGLSGEGEQQAFRELPPIPLERTEELWTLVFKRMLPALDAHDFGAFSEALTWFNHVSGLGFAARQRGAYASPRIAELVETIRGLGVRGIGQSSWGPTVFALFEHEQSARDFQQRLAAQHSAFGPMRIAQPCNTPAEITTSA